MDSDSDDIYEPDEATGTAVPIRTEGGHGEVQMADARDDEEEGEEVEEDDSDDDDINFITDQKDEPKHEKSSQSQRQASFAASQSETRKASGTPSHAIKTESATEAKSTSQTSNERPGTDYPGHHTSTIDPNANPVHPTTGNPIQSTNFDTDFPSESSMPWRKPGSDVTDYFNYGFDEFTWASYCLKAKQMPKEIKEIKDQAEFMKAFVEGIPAGGVPAMPGMPGSMAMPGAQNGAMPSMPGMPNEAEMQQMLAGMMSQGIDPSTMDPNQFMQMMMGGGGQGFGGQGQGPQGLGQGHGPAQPQQQAGFAGSGGGGGFDQGGNFGGGRGRGRGRGRW